MDFLELPGMRWLLLTALVLVAAGAVAWRPAVGKPAETCRVPARDFPTFVAASLTAPRPPLDMQMHQRLETATFALG